MFKQSWHNKQETFCMALMFLAVGKVAVGNYNHIVRWEVWMKSDPRRVFRVASSSHEQESIVPSHSSSQYRLDQQPYECCRDACETWRWQDGNKLFVSHEHSCVYQLMRWHSNSSQWHIFLQVCTHKIVRKGSMPVLNWQSHLFLLCIGIIFIHQLDPLGNSTVKKT
jgi:hypothetical protein